MRIFALKAQLGGVLLLLLLTQVAEPAPAQANPSPAAEEDPGAIFHHSSASRFWLSGQVNLIVQGHPRFRAPYSGPNSLSPAGQTVLSRVITLYTGMQVTARTEVVFDLESAGGHGIGDALGVAGFTNLDVVRNPLLGSKPYVARLMLRRIFPLGRRTVEAKRDPLSLATSRPARRLELRVGKFSLVDFFDLNAVGGDSHLQFLNWSTDNNGAYDYAANTRGYTVGLLLDYEQPRWGLRFAEALLPKIANGIVLDWDLRRAHGENLEWELRHGFLPGRQGALRLLAYANHANMGSYREAINEFRAGRDLRPDIEAHRRQGRVKYGFGANLQQDVGRGVRAFGRWGWNEGRNESFVYTEVNATAAAGADLAGSLWGRRRDRIGGAFIANALSGDHRRYLMLGGRGFLLGDGALHYGRERIFEAYYTLNLARGVSLSFDLQHITNPGYNQDRGPVLVPAVRLHLEL